MADIIFNRVNFFILIIILHNTCIQADSSECGTLSTIGKMSGLIKSHKGFGSSLYPNRLNCTWNIQPPTAFKVKLKFLVFDLENSTGCHTDNLIVSYGRIRQRFCGAAKPTAIATSSQVQLTFRTDENTTSLGFLISYTYYRQPSPLQQCGIITDMGGSGVLTSPNYPMNYSNDISCRWNLKAVHGKLLRLDLDLEIEGTAEDGCPYDYLSVYDMITDQYIGRYCGVIHSKSIPTNTSHIRLDFITDSQNTLSGFVITWHSEDPVVRVSVPNVTASPTISRQTKTHPYHLNSTTSLASSTQYQTKAQSYSNPSHLTSTSTRAAPTSPKDQLSSTPSSHQVPVSSVASSTMQYQTKTRSVSTPPSHPGQGSSIASSSYQTLSSERNIDTVDASICDSKLYLNGSTGSITLPRQSTGEYSPNLDCQWLLVGEAGANMIVNFESFQLETSADCKKDYLEFYDGDSERSRMVAKYCGTDLPASVIATANKLLIKFHSDQSVEGKGITLQYLQMTPVTVPTLPVYHCPKDVVELHSESGTLTSVGFTGYTNYSPDLDCQWQITTTQGKVLKLMFSDFETEYAERCQYDHLEVWDGSVGNMSMLGKYCGIRLPRDVITHTNRVYLKFVSDGAVNGIGFNLTYRTMEKIVACTKDQYKCIDGKCIDKTSVCDNKTDCIDNTDELFCDVNATCGRPSVKATLQEHRIVGGEEAIRGSWPWQTTVSHKGAFMCGGSLLNPYWVITAAHCFGVSIIPKEWQVGIGKHYLMKAEKGVETIGLADIIIHPQYNAHTSSNDIALLRLKQPVNITSRISTICLPSQPQYSGQNCYVTGWGDSYDTCCPDVLKQAMVPILNTSLCNSTNLYNGRVLDSMFCAGYTTQHIDACHGDSGGPLVSVYSDGKWYLQGIISWGIGCADFKHPGIYTDVYQFNSWIQSVVYQI